MSEINIAPPPEDDISRTYAERLDRRELDATQRRLDAAAQGVPREDEIPVTSPAAEAVKGAAGDIAKGVVETPRAIATGVLGAAQEFTETIMQVGDPLAQWLEETAPLGSAPSPEDVFGKIMDDPKSTTGKMVQGVAQFVTGFIPALRATRALTGGAAATKAGQVAQATMSGSLADAAVFDEQEKRLSNLVEEFPALKNPVTEYLKADPADGAAEGKFKQAVEGLALGAAADSFAGLVRMIRAGRVAKTAALAEGEGGLAEDAGATALKKLEAERIDLEPLGNPAGPSFLIDDSTRNAADAFLSGEVPSTGNVAPRVGNVNINRISGQEDVREIIARSAKLFEDRITTKAQSNEQTIKLADDIAVDPQRMQELLNREGALNAAEITAVRFHLHQSGETIRDLAASAMGGSDADKFAFLRQMAFHRSLLDTVSSAGREAGRALQAFNITGRRPDETSRYIREMIAGNKTVEEMAQHIRTLNSNEAITKYVKDSSKLVDKTSDALLEVWINSLLSGPQTHIVNMTSNAIVGLWQVGERRLAESMRTLVGGSGVVPGEAMSMAYGSIQGFKEGLILAGKALRTGEPSDAFSKIEARRHRAVSAEAFGMDETRALGLAVDMLGEVVRVPGRFLTAEDEMFKAIGYRMELNARAHRAAAQEGLSGTAAARRMAEIVNNPPPDLKMAAIDAARYSTFTKPLGRAGQQFTGAVNAFPPAKVVFPFLRTPVNIMKFVGERTPLAPLSTSVREEIAAGGTRRDMALAKIGLGSFIMAAAADMATSGQITGGGPTDPTLKARMRETGWQPYSIKVGDQYVSYNRLDPLGMTLGIAADMADIAGQIEDGEYEEMAGAAVMAVSNNIISKTYMSGMANLMEVFAQPDPDLGATKGERYLQRQISSFVPNLLAQTARAVDPNLRQVETMADAFKRRIPGYSEDLPPRLNLWGDPIVLSGGVTERMMSPLWRSPIRDSPASDAIVENRVPITMPSRKFPIPGVKGANSSVFLTPVQYNRLVSLAGNELKNPETGLGARETIEAIVQGRHQNSAQYAAGTAGPDGTRAIILRTVINNFREAARARLLQENPELRHNVMTIIEEQRALPQ